MTENTENTRAFRRLLPLATPFIYGTCCYLAVAVPYVLEGMQAYAVMAAAFLVCLAGTGGLAVFSVDQGAGKLRKLALATTPTLLAAGSFLFLMLIDSSTIRFITVTGGMLLLAAYYARLDMGDDAGFANLSRAVRAVALFLLLAFSFGIGRFVYVPLPLMTAVAALGLAFAGHQDLRGVTNGRTAAGYAAVIGLLGAELYLGLSFLPTPFMTNAAVLLVAMELISTAMRGVFAQTEAPLVPRLQLAAFAALAVSIFGTAPWF